KAMKKVAGTLKITLAQYRSQAAFAMFASDLDAATRQQLIRGERLMELLKQPQYTPYPVEDQVVSVWAGTNGYLDEVPVENVLEYEAELLDYMRRNTKVLDTIATTGKLEDETLEEMTKATEQFTKEFLVGHGITVEGDDVEVEDAQEQIVAKRG
ncbi:MAG: F0F1 ATP synthase subunit alpha, partial [Actinomycetaceae bacterium]|nr:F0F1 ATP synthase subunit alpha [Actinomycetaceae bacterium]